MVDNITFFYNFLGFWYVAVNIVYKLQLFCITRPNIGILDGRAFVLCAFTRWRQWRSNYCCRQTFSATLQSKPLLSTHANRWGVDISVTVFVRLRISPSMIKLAESNFAGRFIGVQGKESHIFGNFAPTRSPKSDESASAHKYSGTFFPDTVYNENTMWY